MHCFILFPMCKSTYFFLHTKLFCSFLSTKLLDTTFFYCLILTISVFVSVAKQVHLEAKTHIGIFEILQAGLNK